MHSGTSFCSCCHTLPSCTSRVPQRRRRGAPAPKIQQPQPVHAASRHATAAARATGLVPRRCVPDLRNKTCTPLPRTRAPLTLKNTLTRLPPLFALLCPDTHSRYQVTDGMAAPRHVARPPLTSASVATAPNVRSLSPWGCLPVTQTNLLPSSTHSAAQLRRLWERPCRRRRPAPDAAERRRAERDRKARPSPPRCCCAQPDGTSPLRAPVHPDVTHAPPPGGLSVRQPGGLCDGVHDGRPPAGSLPPCDPHPQRAGRPPQQPGGPNARLVRPGECPGHCFRRPHPAHLPRRRVSRR